MVIGVISKMSRTEIRVERGKFYLDVYVPSGTELLFSFYSTRQSLLSADHAVLFLVAF
jgi:hypothetical protein